MIFQNIIIVSNIKSDWRKVLKEENLDHTHQKENKVSQIINQQNSSINEHLYNILLKSQCMQIVKSEGKWIADFPG